MVSKIDHSPWPSCPDRFNFADYVLARGAQDKVALEIVGARATTKLTYGEIRARVFGYAADLERQGIKRGDFIGLRLKNQVEFPLLFLACAYIGAIPVATSPQLTAHEYDGLLSRLPMAKTLYNAALDVLLRDHAFIDVRHISPNRSPHPGIRTRSNDPAYCVFTSGTGGDPLPVLHAHRAVWALQMMWQDWYDLTDQDRMFHAGAFNWTYTMGTGLLDPWAMGATAIVMDPNDPMPLDQAL